MIQQRESDRALIHLGIAWQGLHLGDRDHATKNSASAGNMLPQRTYDNYDVVYFLLQCGVTLVRSSAAWSTPKIAFFVSEVHQNKNSLPGL